MNDCGWFFRDALLNASKLAEIPLFISCVLFAWMLVHVVDRSIAFGRARRQNRSFTEKISLLLKRDEWKDVLALGEALSSSYDAGVWSRGLREFQKTCNEISVQNAVDVSIRAVQISKNEKREQLRRGLNRLSAIAITAPCIGQFGTCVCFLDSFKGYSGTPYRYIALLATNVANALAPLMVGLIVGVFATLLFNWQSRRVAILEADMEAASLELTRYLRTRDPSCRIQVPKSLRMPSNPRPAWILLSPQIGVLYSQILLLLTPLALLVFPLWGRYVFPPQGLYTLTYSPDSWQFRHIDCQRWVVRVQSSDAWYLNSARIKPDVLPDALREQIGTRTDCIVFFGAESDVGYKDAIRAIDLISETPGKVVLLTPQTKPRRIP